MFKIKKSSPEVSNGPLYRDVYRLGIEGSIETAEYVVALTAHNESRVLLQIQGSESFEPWYKLVDGDLPNIRNGEWVKL